MVNPDDVIEQYGADTMRLYEMFMGPLEVQKPWQMSGVEGVYRFLQRVWRLVVDEKDGRAQPQDHRQSRRTQSRTSNRTLHKTIKKIDSDTETLQMNTAIAQMMIFVNQATSADDPAAGNPHHLSPAARSLRATHRRGAVATNG